MSIYLDVKLTLTEEQIEKVKQETIKAIDEALMDGKLDAIIKETIKGQIKSIANEYMQSKDYKTVIFDKVSNYLLGEVQ